MTRWATVADVTAEGVWVRSSWLQGVVGPIPVTGAPSEGDPVLVVRTDEGELAALYGGPVTGDPRTLPRTYWNDLRVSLSTGCPNTDPPTFGTFRNGVQAWAFAANATEQLHFQAQVPHGWVVGSQVRPHIHWSPGNSTNTGSVVWALEYSWANVTDPFPATSTLTVTQAAAGVAYQHQLAPFGNVDGAGKRESSVFMCRIARVGGDAADTFTGAAFGISVDFHYLAVALGSVDEIPAIEA